MQASTKIQQMGIAYSAHGTDEMHITFIWKRCLGGKIILKRCDINRVKGCLLHEFSPKYQPVAGSREHSYEPAGALMLDEFRV
jgi:hypothetical protein